MRRGDLAVGQVRSAEAGSGYLAPGTVPACALPGETHEHVPGLGDSNVEAPNWLEPNPNSAAGVMNNFRQNLPENDALAAPDLVVSLTLEEISCQLIARVCNAGDIVAGAGVPITFWDNTTMTELPCSGGTPMTGAPLTSGACTDVTCVWNDAPSSIDVRACVDNATYACASSGGTNNECNEGNNLDSQSGDYDCTPIGIR